MKLPKGNTLIEKISLPFMDISEMLTNLEQEGFSGYVKFNISSHHKGIIFFIHGTIARVLEVGEHDVKVLSLPHILNKIKKKEVQVSTYVLSHPLVNVLSNLFAFQSLYLDFAVKKKELKMVLGTLDSDKYSGLIRVDAHDGKKYLMVDQGKIVFDSFTDNYGDILCGQEKINTLLEQISKDGANINVFAERAEEIENKKKLVEDEMDKAKQLISKFDTGLFSSGNMIRIDEYIAKEWGIKPTIIFNVEVESPDGIIHNLKCCTGKKLGGYVSCSKALANQIKIKEGELINIKPLKA